MKATLKQLFNEVSYLNPTLNEVSSVGSYVSKTAQMIADSVSCEFARILPKDSLAYSMLLKSNRLTEKQLWVIAYELEKNEEYCINLGRKLNREAMIEKAKEDKKKDKLSANKAGSQDVLDFVKSNGKKLGDYYAFVKKTKSFAKEFYSKKFTMTSAEAFIQA